MIFYTCSKHVENKIRKQKCTERVLLRMSQKYYLFLLLCNKPIVITKIFVLIHFTFSPKEVHVILYTRRDMLSVKLALSSPNVTIFSI